MQQTRLSPGFSSDKELSFDRMKVEAAKIGADAVIKVAVSTRYEGQDFNWITGKNLGPRNRHFLEGIAVIYLE